MILSERLLSIGGNAIFGDQLQYDPDKELLLREGTIFSNNKVLLPMEQNACHWNIAQLFREKLLDNIVIGYALSNEDIWFQHTWGIRGNVIVETSKVNFLNIKTYFGIVLATPELFVQLCENNPKGNGKVRRNK